MWLGLSNDTICAVSTARGVGGIAVIRLSGPRALEIARRCCPRLPLTVQSHRIYLCPFLEVKNGQLLDEVLASYFAHGRSFTGDETVEFSSHGGVVVPHLILQTLIEQGARLAQPGEFTFRAFRNGKLDLVQAEGVLQLIESQSTAAARLAIRQVKGHLSRKFLSLEEDLTWLLAQLEANINFSEDGLEFASQQSLNVRLTQLGDTVNGMIESFKTNHIVKEGLQVALVGAPNVGKSSLLNALVGEDSAIVTEHPGTTRDFVEGYVVSEGVLINFIDTAGLRETLDPVESIGIRRTLERIQTVDVVLWIRDACEQQLSSKPDVGGVRLVQVWNKCDMCQVLTVNKHQDSEFLVSAKTGLGLEDLRKYLVMFSQQCFQDFSEGVIQTRHKEILLRMQGRIKDGLCLMQKDSSPELLVFELQQCLQDVYQVLGKCFDDQVIDRVFKEFCLGK